MNKNDAVFRANVGAIIYNSEGKVLAFERSDITHNWQFPQGGVNINEKPLEAIKRELKEETNIEVDRDLILKGEYPYWLAYEIPEQIRVDYLGQVQKWFVFEIKSNVKINLNSVLTKEFINYRWMEFNKLVDQIVDFKKNIYQTLQKWFDENFRPNNKK